MRDTGPRVRPVGPDRLALGNSRRDERVVVCVGGRCELPLEEGVGRD